MSAQTVPELALRLCAAWGNTATSRSQIAGAIGVSERTLRRWARRQKDGRALVGRRGRHAQPVDRSRRQEVITALVELGPCAGVNVLRGLFCDVPYRAIARMKRRFARVLQRRRGWYQKRLVWQRAGSVWATDFTHPEGTLDAPNDRICLVRDLGSGAQLAAVPCRGERAGVICAVLVSLFCELGAPLVIKHDNGGAFVAGQTQALLNELGVVALRSPPRTPQYNGSCERSGGVLKHRIAHIAARRGHAHQWTRADLAAGVRQANRTARPRGANGATPSEAFAARRPIGEEEREAFLQTRACAIAHAVTWHKAERGKMPSCAKRAAILRKATQRALCELGYLKIRRGRISTVVSTWLADIKA
jgi:transposase InsO family protein